MPLKSKKGLVECLRQISTSTIYRQNYLLETNYNSLLTQCLQVADVETDSTQGAIISNCVQCLINVCSLINTQRVYIPGETSIVHWLRRRSYELGTYMCIVHLSAKIQQSKHWHALQALIETRFFNLVDLQDLEFNLGIVRSARAH